MTLEIITDTLIEDLDGLRFGPPVSRVYNPLIYARDPYFRYLERFGAAPREIVLFGMNPGPFGMAQTGVPFGDVAMVRGWLGIYGPVGKPQREHPKRPVQGFACPRREVSGMRLWGWASSRFKTPEAFFRRFFVLNYCPLCFIEESGKNRTPDKLPAREREALFAACDHALRKTVECFSPLFLFGVGGFAEKRLRAALPEFPGTIGQIPHPSPANPMANRGWADVAEAALTRAGVLL